MKKTILVDTETGKSYESDRSVAELLGCNVSNNSLREFCANVERVMGVIKSNAKGLDEKDVLKLSVIMVSLANMCGNSIEELVKDYKKNDFGLITNIIRFDSMNKDVLFGSLGIK